MKDWNASLYRKFEKERTQPAKDLAARIDVTNPSRIIDIGCGPGNSTKELLARWQTADICGLDSSPNMLEQAKAELPQLKWILGDASGDLSYLGTFDIVFSNAALQWIPDHTALLPRLFSLVSEAGALAIQIPNTSDMEITTAIKATVQSDKWAHYFENLSGGAAYREPSFYYDILCKLAKELYIWETQYYHVMESAPSIVDWYESTGLRPFLNKLPDVFLATDFKADLLRQIEQRYPKQADGRVLFPFRRIFILAYK